MAGFVAAAHARELGAEVVLLEKGDRAGGSMRLSSGVVWRYRDLSTFRSQCPAGDPELQRAIVEHLDRDLAWLASLGAGGEPWATNPLTVGVRFDVETLTGALVRRAGEPRLRASLGELGDTPTVLATGGFPAGRDLLRLYVTTEADAVLVRANPWSVGDGLRLALATGATSTDGMDEFYGRSLPAPPAVVTSDRLVELTQLYARHAVVESLDGETYPRAAVTWHESDVAQWIARRPGARAWYVVAPPALGLPAGRGTVGEAIEAARSSGGRVEQRGDRTAVLVAPGVTSTLGGIRVDADARVLRADGAHIAGLYAAGSDVGGISTGGYSSGLAAALVLGRIAAERALGLG